MFFKGSRYKELPEINTTDAQGQVARPKMLRWIPDTPGTFLHTVNQANRLDLLGYKYYGEPKKWWLICDANPKFALPTDLLDRHPIIQETFNLEPPEDENKWPILIRALRELSGIHEVLADTFEVILGVTYNVKELDRENITHVVTSQGYVIKDISKQERIGQKITIPPNKIV